MLISDHYRAQNIAFHAQSLAFGGKAQKRMKNVLPLVERFQPGTILDYGCGKGGLVRALQEKGLSVQGYDPCVSEFDIPPSPADLVVCYEGPEHFEEEFIDDTFAYISSLTKHVAWIAMAMRESAEILPDGTNAHVTVKYSQWWLDRMTPHFKSVEVQSLVEGKVMVVLCFTH
jgi:SAM-dependent methyltransferase